MLKFSWSMLIAGLALFLYQGGELLMEHTTWAELKEPAAVGELLKLLGGVIGMVIGAAGIPLSKLMALKAAHAEGVQMPRPPVA